MNQTNIEWTDFTWNPVTGCSKRCEYCYAWRMAKRMRGRFGYPAEDPFQVLFHPARLYEPMKRRKPAKIFTCSMGELFDPQVPRRWRDLVFEQMESCNQHVFQLLTKQPHRLKGHTFPRNLWLGVSVETQAAAMDRLPYLLDPEVDAPLKFASFEPLYGPIDIDLGGLDWIIIGAQTQPWRPPAPMWVKKLILNAGKNGIPYFLKDNLAPRIVVTSDEQQFPEFARADWLAGS